MHSIRTWRLAAAIGVALVLAALTGCSGESERDLIASARAYVAKNDTKAAVIQLKTALQKNPQSGEARFLLGDLLFKNGDVAAAVLELEKAHDLKHNEDEVLPLLAKALVAIGQAKKVTDLYGRVALTEPAAAGDLKAMVAAAYAAQGMPERSEAAVNAALQLDPKNATARLLQARQTAGRGAIDEALALVDAVLADDPKRRDAWYLKGSLLWAGKDDVDGAIIAFRETLSEDPRYMPGHSALISLMLQTRGVAGFRAQFAELKKVLPNLPETRFYEAQLALLDKDLKRAREGTQQLLRFAPESVRVLQLAGAIEAEGGSLLLAETNLTKALQLAPGLTLARRVLAETYLRSGQPAKALSVLQPLLDKNALNAQALALAAEAHLQNGDPTTAEVYFTRASKANPADPKVRTALALTQISRGNTDIGFAQLESLASNDTSTYADLALISARLRRNDFDGALTAIDRLQGKVPDKPLPHHLRGRVLAERKDVIGARASFDKALVADPVYFPAVAALAALDLAGNKPEEARKRYETLLAREPKNYRALLALADLRGRAGATPTEIGNLLVDAVKLNPTEVAPRLLLIEHHLGQRDAKAARSAAQDAVAAVPDSLQLLDALGRTQLVAGDTQQAISTFGKVAAAQPASAQPLLRLADAYKIAQDYVAAAATLRKALAITPNLLVAQRDLVKVALISKRVDDALAVARTVQKQRPTEPAGYLLEGEIHSNQKHLDLAIGAFRLALERSPTTEIATGLHAIYAEAGRAADAERFASSWEREHPRDAGFQFHLGSMAIGRKDFAAAEARYRRVLAMRPDDALALNNVSWLMIQQRKPGALQFAERANQLLPDQAWVMDTLAAALAADDQLPKALEWQRKTIGKAPNILGYQLNLAKLLIKAGDKPAARIELERLSKLGDKFSGQPEVSALLKTL